MLKRLGSIAPKTSKTPSSENVTFSEEAKIWLENYLQAVEPTFSSQVESSYSFPLTLAALNFESNGDYTEQFSLLQAKNLSSGNRTEAASNLFELILNNRHVVLLGKGGAGKTGQLLQAVRQAQKNLGRVVKSINSTTLSTSDKGQLFFPVFLDLTTLNNQAQNLKSESVSQQPDLFQTILDHSLQQFIDEPAPSNLFQEVTPLLLIDNLEQFEPSLAPIFFYNLSQWLEKVGSNARIVFSCRYLDFPLYHSWFKDDTEKWQFFALLSAEWSVQKQSLASQINSARRSELEQTGLTRIFTDPALSRILLPQIRQLSDNSSIISLLPSLLDAIFGEHELSAVFLARLSRLLSEEHKKLGAFDILPQSLLEKISQETQKHNDQIQNSFTTCLAKAIAVGLVERHSILNWTRFATPGVELLVTVWFCSHLPDQDLPAVLNEVLGRLEVKGQDEEIKHFTKLMYLAVPIAKRSNLLAAFLGYSPEMHRLQLLFDISELDRDFLITWQIFLNDLLHNPSKAALAQSLAKLIMTLSKQAIQRKISGWATVEKLALIELSLETLLKSASQTDSEVVITLAQLQEQLGKTDKAVQNYRLIASKGSHLPFLEARLGLARLLNISGEFSDAANYLIDLNTRLLSSQAEINNLLSEVSRNSGDYENAINYARCAVQLEPHSVDYQLNLALALHNSGHTEKAEQQLTKLVAANPNFAKGFYQLGKLQLERGANDLALPNLQRAVELSPNTGKYLYELGCSLATQTQYEQAFTYLEAAVTQVKDAANYHLILGLTALKLYRFSKAENAFAEAQKLEPNSVISFICLAATHYVRNNRTVALANLKKAWDLDKNNPLLLLLMGLVKESQQNFEAAISYYSQAAEFIETAPTIREALWLGLGRTARITNSLVTAESYCEKAAELQPDSLEVLLEQGKLAYDQQVYDKAVALFARALSLMAEMDLADFNRLVWPLADEDSVLLFTQPARLQFELPLNYSMALVALNRLAEAQNVLEHLLKNLTFVPAEQFNIYLSNHYRVVVRYQLAEILLKTKDVSRALSLLQEVVATVPNNYAYRMALAKAWTANADNANFEAALQELKQACQLEPQKSEVYAEIAELYLQKNQTLDSDQMLISLNNYLKALENEPTNLIYLYRATQLAFRLQQSNQTLELTNRMLQTLDSQKNEDENLAFDAYLLAACVWESRGNLEKAQAAIVQTLRGSVKGKATYLLVAARLARKANQFAQQKQALTSIKERESLPELLQAALSAEEAQLALTEHRYAEAANLLQTAIKLQQQFLNAGSQIKLNEFYYEVPSSAESNPLNNSVGNAVADILAVYQLTYAETLYHLGLYPAALSNLNAVMAAHSSYAQGYRLQAEILYAQADYAAALEAINTALKLESSAINYYWLGLIQFKLGQAALAVKAFEKIKTENAPIVQQPDYFLNLGQAYEELGDLMSARTTYAAGLHKDANHPHLQQALAHCYLKAGQHREAIQPLQAAVLSDPTNSEYRLALAKLYEDIDWWGEAVTQYEQLNSLSPAIPDSWFKLGRALLRTGRVQQGRDNLKQAIRLDDNNAEFYYELGKSFVDSYFAAQSQKIMVPSDLQGMFSSPVANA